MERRPSLRTRRLSATALGLVSWRSEPSLEQLLLVTDPGPDPDDVKALVIAAVLSHEKQIDLRAVIANGGQQPRERAALARCILDQMGEHSIPVGVGSEGRAYDAQPHEYSLDGFDLVDRAALPDGHELMLQTLRSAPPLGLTLVCISSLRDLADVMDAHPDLVVEKVKTVAIMGGLEPCDSAPSGWRPDTSVNNEFDPEAAAAVYAFCFEHGVPMAIVSRHAVPLLPMQLAKSFAERTECPLMRYLADAQFLGLEGLWKKLCAGKLPARCTKQWYFETFCGVGAARFAARGYEALDEDEDIVAHLNGFVKPYDVICMMTVLPATRAYFAEFGGSKFEHNGAEHLLLLEPEHTIDVQYVLHLLRNTYHAAVLAVAEAAGLPRARDADSRLRASVSLASGTAHSAITLATASASRQFRVDQSPPLSPCSPGYSPLGGTSPGVGGSPCGSPPTSAHGASPGLGSAEQSEAQSQGGDSERRGSECSERRGSECSGGAEHASGGSALAAGAELTRAQLPADEAGADGGGAGGGAACSSGAGGAAGAQADPGSFGLGCRARARCESSSSPLSDRRRSGNAPDLAPNPTGISGERVLIRPAPSVAPPLPTDLSPLRTPLRAADGSLGARRPDSLRVPPRTRRRSGLAEGKEEGAREGGGEARARRRGARHARSSSGLPSPGGGLSSSELSSSSDTGGPSSPEVLARRASRGGARARAAAAAAAAPSADRAEGQQLGAAPPNGEPRRAQPAPGPSLLLRRSVSDLGRQAVSDLGRLGAVRTATRFVSKLTIATQPLGGGSSRRGRGVADYLARALDDAHRRDARVTAATSALGGALLLVALGAELAFSGARADAACAAHAPGASPAPSCDRAALGGASVAAGAAAAHAALRLGRLVALALLLLSLRPHEGHAVRVRRCAALGAGGAGVGAAMAVEPARAAAALARAALGGDGAARGARLGACAAVGAAEHVTELMVCLGAALALGADSMGLPERRRTRVVLGQLWRSLGACAIANACATSLGALARAALCVRTARGAAWALAALAASGATALLGSAALLPALQQALPSALARATGAAGLRASTAALIGFGTAHECEPDEVVAEAALSFKAVALDEQTLQQLPVLQRAPGTSLSPTLTTERSRAAAARRAAAAQHEWQLGSLGAPSWRLLLSVPAGLLAEAAADGAARLRGAMLGLALGWRDDGAGAGAAEGGAADGLAADKRGPTAAAAAAAAAAGCSLPGTPGGAGPRMGRRMSACAHLPPSASSPSAQVLAAPPLLQRASSDLNALPPSERRARMSEVRMPLPAATGGPAASSARAPPPMPSRERVDAYVVHSWDDDSETKLRALTRWARGFEGAHGRPPRVWLDAACADPSLLSVERLSHVPAYMARCRRLLVLMGPTLADQLWAVAELFTWRVMGGRLEAVEVVPVTNDAAERAAVLASLDAFHAMWAKAPSAHSARPLVQLVELAGVSQFNEVVRGYMPTVRDALAAEARAAAAAESARAARAPAGAASSPLPQRAYPQGQKPFAEQRTVGADADVSSLVAVRPDIKIVVGNQ